MTDNEETLSGWISAPVAPAMLTRVEAMRRKMGISKSELVRRALQMYLRKQETRK